MKLITEKIEDAKIVITEGKGGKRNTFIEGVFLQADITNRNGRMYPMSIMEREVAKYNENYVGTGRALGELGHPDGPSINLDRASHLITSLKREGNNLFKSEVGNRSYSLNTIELNGHVISYTT